MKETWLHIFHVNVEQVQAANKLKQKPDHNLETVFGSFSDVKRIGQHQNNIWICVNTAQLKQYILKLTSVLRQVNPDYIKYTVGYF